MIPVVELLRVSTAGQSEGLNIPAQHSVNERTCSQYGLEAVEVVEIVMSGAEVADTPEMGRVLELVRTGRVRGVVLAEYSRLFRPDRWTDLRVLQTFADHGANIYLPAGPLDLLTEAGFVSATVNNMVAALERRRIKERMHRGKEEHRRRGAHVAGGCGIPFGMSYTKASGWAYTPDIERVRMLFKRFLAGHHNFDALGQELGLARTTTRFILTNPVYTGWRIYDEKRDATPAGKLVDRKIPRLPNETIRVRLPLEPVISEADFHAVQLVVQDIHRRHLKTEHAQAFAYRGHLTCDCGRGIYCLPNFRGGNPTFSYFCPSRTKARGMGAPKCPTGYMRREKLEPLLDATVAERLTDAGLITSALSEYLASMDASWRAIEPDESRVAGQVAELKKRRQRVLDAFVDGVMGKAERTERLRTIDAEIRALQNLKAPAHVSPDVEALVTLLVRRLARWQTLTNAGKLEALDSLGLQIHIGRYEVRGVSLPFDSDSASHLLTADAVSTLYIPFAA